jgi:hypothetical protein
MKHYVGERTPEGVEVLVLERDRPAGGYPLDPRFDLRRHADGLNFGYAGSGPAQLSLALLADALGDDDRALGSYQRFKAREVSRWEGDRFEISEEDIRQIVSGLERDRGRSR